MICHSTLGAGVPGLPLRCAFGSGCSSERVVLVIRSMQAHLLIRGLFISVSREKRRPRVEEPFQSPLCCFARVVGLSPLHHTVQYRTTSTLGGVIKFCVVAVILVVFNLVTKGKATL